MRELRIEAKKENLDTVLDFTTEGFDEMGISAALRMRIEVAVEEIFVNIASYAYGSDTGDAVIKTEVSGQPSVWKTIFIDEGVMYDPLKKPDPDISLSAEDRAVGGLGIFMVKKSMDSMEYEYTDGKNILTITKILEE
ncbi:MAG: ATP-binding protein [Lachnospiraceae bacterium]|nr:ATP-binding protein [Lachnospiraceae bacterium]